jgi:hypothetical protein
MVHDKLHFGCSRNQRLGCGTGLCLETHGKRVPLQSRKMMLARPHLRSQPVMPCDDSRVLRDSLARGGGGGESVTRGDHSGAHSLEA